MWETIIGTNFAYNISNKQEHTFDVPDGRFLLSFANPDEATTFSSEAQQLMKKLKEQKEKRKLEQQRSNNSNVNSPAPQYNPTVTTTSSSNYVIKKKEPVNAKGTLKGKKFTKADISTPKDFKHLDHMGLSECFFQNPQDDLLRKFLKDMNLESVLENDQEKQKVYEFIEAHGGYQQLEREMKDKKQPMAGGFQKSLPRPTPTSRPAANPSQMAPSRHGQTPPSAHNPPPPPPPTASVTGTVKCKEFIKADLSTPNDQYDHLQKFLKYMNLESVLENDQKKQKVFEFIEAHDGYQQDTHRPEPKFEDEQEGNAQGEILFQ